EGGSRSGSCVVLAFSLACGGLACGGLAADGVGGGGLGPFDPLDPASNAGRGGIGAGSDPVGSASGGVSGERPGSRPGRGGTGAGGRNGMPTDVGGGGFSGNGFSGNGFGGNGGLAAGNDDPELVTPDEDCPPNPMRLDELVTQLANAASGEAPGDLRYIRYVSAGALRTTCSVSTSRSIARARFAVDKVVNSLSTTAVPVPTRRIDSSELSLRIDLRDYGWDRPIQVNGVLYADGWEALVAHTPMALEFVGGAADTLKQQVGAPVPWLLANGFVAAATTSDVYYAFTQAPDTLAQLKGLLGIAPPEDLPAGSWLRAGFSDSGVSRQDRGIARYAGNSIGDRFFWQTFDYAPNTAVPTLFLEPLTARADGAEVIYTLPNGLPAYFVADAAGRRVNESVLSIDPALGGPPRVMASCGSCHNSGLIAFRDAVRAFVDANIAGTFTAEEAQAVRDAYPVDMEPSRVNDSNRLVIAMAQAGQPDGTPDPVGRTTIEYHAAVERDVVASELYVLPEALDAELGRLPPALATSITTNGLSREAFEASYHDALCVLGEGGPIVPLGCP
ncbi:MAG TPA: hypothetical protein VMG12_01525, partial [Polyangiaceae bacterium]|nr:hypothetical protein [Polyangiaceae bacterium]